MRIAVLALQGAFLEHEMMLRKLGIDCFEVRRLEDWQQEKDGLIIPGGESTTQGKLLRDLSLLDPIREAIEAGLPVFGTCAGLILLAREVEGIDGDIPMTFIRAPYIKESADEVEILSEVDGHIVAARQGNQLVTAFHPELDSDMRVHEYFLEMVKGR